MTTPNEQATEKKTDKKADKPKFTFSPVRSKPSRRYRKGSKYDPILEGFLKSGHKLVKVELEGVDSHYLRTQLNKRIEVVPKFSKIKVSVANSVCYLELK